MHILSRNWRIHQAGFQTLTTCDVALRQVKCLCLASAVLSARKRNKQLQSGKFCSKPHTGYLQNQQGITSRTPP